MKKRTYFLIALCLLITGSSQPLWAQSYSLTTRAFVQSPTALGMGDAAVAFPNKATAFFYNPAHLAYVTSPRPYINLLGVRGANSLNLRDQIDFAIDRAEPAIRGGLESMESDELVALYDEARALGRQRAYVGADLLLPSVMVQYGGVGLGAGLFTSGRFIHHRMESGGAGIPVIDLAAQGDVMALAAGAVDLANYGLSNISVGFSGKYTRRYLSLKHKLLDTIEEDEDLYVLRGSSFGIDAGLLYEMAFVPLPGRLNFGLAVFDLAAAPFDYVYDRSLLNQGPDRQELIEAEVTEARNRYELSPSYRMGLAYTVPSVAGLLQETGLALDYVAYADPLIEQSTLAHLRMGIQSKVGRVLALRLGLNQGYTTFGAGLHFGYVRLDYAYYGIEEGRIAGQIPSWNHSLQLAIGLF